MPLAGTTGTQKSYQDSALRYGAIETDQNTATAASNAATISAYTGVITTESLTTAAGATYTCTVTDTYAHATDIVFTAVWNGTSSTGTPCITTVTPADGSFVIIVQNIHASAAFNGTLKIGFELRKRQARGI